MANSHKIAYLVSRFPKISETFVLFEMLALRANGADVNLFALKHERQKLMHNEARAILPEVQYCHPLHPLTLLDALGQFVKTPGQACRTAAALWKQTKGSLRFRATSLLALPSALALSRRLVRGGYTHLHAHFANVPTATAWVVHQLTGLPYSFTTHGSDLHRDQTMLTEKISASKATITVSEFNAEIMRRLAPPEDLHKIHVIHCGADGSVFTPRNSPDPKITERLQLACLGSLLPVKGQSVLLTALAEVSEISSVAIDCHLIGDGPCREQLETLAQTLNLDVVFHGAVTQKDVASLLPGFDIVVAPSVPTADGRKEGIPVSLMEAMSSGCAVIASDLTGIPELVQHERTGLLVPPGDPTALAQAITRFATDRKLRTKCTGNALALVREQYDLQKNANQLLSLIEAEIK